MDLELNRLCQRFVLCLEAYSMKLLRWILCIFGISVFVDLKVYYILPHFCSWPWSQVHRHWTNIHFQLLHWRFRFFFIPCPWSMLRDINHYWSCLCMHCFISSFHWFANKGILPRSFDGYILYLSITLKSRWWTWNSTWRFSEAFLNKIL